MRSVTPAGNTAAQRVPAWPVTVTRIHLRTILTTPASPCPRRASNATPPPAWAPAGFDHSLSTFALTGAHTDVSCAACHTTGTYPGTSSDCGVCHATDYAATTNPNHAALTLSQQCTDCHTTTAWQPAEFDHSLVNFPLTGAHQSATCAACHVSGQYPGTATDCWSCHQASYTKSTNPRHAALALPHDCQNCHTTTAWQPAEFDHSLAAFALTGAHTSVSCVACHPGGQYSGTASTCFDCHTADFQATTIPDHETGQLPHDCRSCHTTTAWEPASFNHSATAFPLLGAHQSVACAACHVNGQFAGTATACFACHTDDFAATTDPAHVPASFSHDCQGCHSMTGWAAGSMITTPPALRLPERIPLSAVPHAM